MCKRDVTRNLQEVLETATRSKKKKTTVGSQRLRTADILSTTEDSTAHDSTREQSRQGDAETDKE